MFAARSASAALNARRAFSTSAANLSKVAVLGAGGGIGQPLSLLLKLNKDVTDLRLYDIRGAPGVGADLGHIDTPAVVKGFAQEDLKGALTGAEIVVIPAGVPRKPGMTRDDLFNTNASIVRDLAQGIADFCPKAAVLIISNPVNSTVPIAAEVFKKAGTYDPKKLFGVTTLDVVRSSTFVAQVTETTDKVADYVIPVIGGHSGVTIIPLLSQSKPAVPESVINDKATLDALVNRIQFGGDEVVKAKDGAGSATLSMAHAGAKFASLVLRAVYKGEKGLVSPSFVDLNADAASGAALREELGQKDLEFFSSNIELGPEGVSKIAPVGKVTAAEQELIKACLPELEKNIAKGKAFILGA